MQRLPIFIVFILLISSNSVSAKMTCQTDSFANKTCRDEQGNTWFGRTDAAGNEQWTDSKGNMINGIRDSFGNMTYKDSSGQVRGKKDSFGNEAI